MCPKNITRIIIKIDMSIRKTPKENSGKIEYVKFNWKNLKPYYS